MVNSCLFRCPCWLLSVSKKWGLVSADSGKSGKKQMFFELLMYFKGKDIENAESYPGNRNIQLYLNAIERKIEIEIGNRNFEFLWQTGLESHSVELYPLSIFFIYLLFLHVLLHTLLISQCLSIEQEFCQKHVYGWGQYKFWGGRQV